MSIAGGGVRFSVKVDDRLHGGRQCKALPVERKEEPSAERILESAVRLHPVPLSAEFLREEPSACVGVTGDQLSNFIEFPLGVGPSPISHFLRHEKYVS